MFPEIDAVFSLEESFLRIGMNQRLKYYFVEVSGSQDKTMEIRESPRMKRSILCEFQYIS